MRFPSTTASSASFPAAPLIGRLGYGELRTKQEETVHRYYVDGGFAQVRDNVVTVLTNRALTTDAIDPTAAARTRAGPEKPAHSDQEFAEKQKAVARSRAMLCRSKALMPGSAQRTHQASQTAKHGLDTFYTSSGSKRGISGLPAMPGWRGPRSMPRAQPSPVFSDLRGALQGPSTFWRPSNVGGPNVRFVDGPFFSPLLGLIFAHNFFQT